MKKTRMKRRRTERFSRHRKNVKEGGSNGLGFRWYGTLHGLFFKVVGYGAKSTFPYSELLIQAPGLTLSEARLHQNAVPLH